MEVAVVSLVRRLPPAGRIQNAASVFAHRGRRKADPRVVGAYIAAGRRFSVKAGPRFPVRGTRALQRVPRPWVQWCCAGRVRCAPVADLGHPKRRKCRELGGRLASKKAGSLVVEGCSGRVLQADERSVYDPVAEEADPVLGTSRDRPPDGQGVWRGMETRSPLRKFA